MDYLLQAALFHDVAKYGEFLNPSKLHENYAYELIRENGIDIPEIAQEIIRLHIHFGITYNGEYNPQVMIDEIHSFHQRGWKRKDIQKVVVLTALFTFADVAADGPITNTM